MSCRSDDLALSAAFWGILRHCCYGESCVVCPSVSPFPSILLTWHPVFVTPLLYSVTLTFCLDYASHLGSRGTICASFHIAILGWQYFWSFSSLFPSWLHFSWSLDAGRRTASRTFLRLPGISMLLLLLPFNWLIILNLTQSFGFVSFSFTTYYYYSSPLLWIHGYYLIAV